MLCARDGDTAAFDALAERYAPRLRRFAETVAWAGADAEAVAQETLMRAYAARERYRPEAAFSTWLFTIARHEAARASSREKAAPREMRPPAGPPDPESAAIAAERFEIVRRAMRELPRPQCEAVALTRFCGLNCRETARAMQTSEGAVRTAVYRGLNTLRRRLNVDA